MAYNLGQVDPEQPTELYADRRDEDLRPRPRRLLRIVVALAVMGVFAGGLWFAYKAGMHRSGAAGDSADIPLIRADTRPIKVKPENPGGMQIPDRDMLIYGQQRPQVEHLLPPPETPMARPAPPPPPPTPAPAPTPAPLQTQAETAAAPPPPASPAAPAVAAGPPAAAPTPARPVPIRPAPAQPALSQPALSPAAVAAARELGLTPAEISPRSSALRSASAKPGAVRLQLGAVRSESEARGTWDRLKQRNADLLGKLSGGTIRAELGDKGVYYRIQTGPVADPSTADRICGELRQRHLACVIVR
jgi:hypothetical protein